MAAETVDTYQIKNPSKSVFTPQQTYKPASVTPSPLPKQPATITVSTKKGK